MERESRATSDGVPSQVTHLTIAYIVALSIVALLSIAGQWMVQRSLSAQRGDSTVVNIAGRQRMLSQRLAKAAIAWEREPSLASRQQRLAELSETLTLWRRSHRGLQQGDETLALPGNNSRVVRQMFAEIEPIFASIESAANELLESAALQPEQSPVDLGDAPIARILTHEPKFLAAMDQLVRQFEHEAQQRVERLQWIERGLLMLTLIVLLIEGRLIFRPAVERIRQATIALHASQREMAAAKEAAEAANAAKTRFLANVSHELRNPLHVILGHLDLLKRGNQNPETEQQLGHIDVAARSLLDLVNDLLDIGMLERGESRLDLEDVRLDQLITEAWSMLRPEAHRRKLAWNARVCDAMRIVGKIDPRRVRQILLNLLGNALKFTKTGGISLEAERFTLYGQDWFRCRVIDTGPGIAEEHRERIFMPFSQADESIRRLHGGAGLGLAICRQLADRMGGLVKLESSSSSGSAFVLELPFVEVPQEAATIHLPSSPAPLPQTSNPLDLLVVDDDPVNTQLLVAILESLGHRATACQSASEAIERLKRDTFDAVLLDIQMPETSGTDIAAWYRQHDNDVSSRTRLIALTASPAIAKEVREKAGLFDAVLTKPIDVTRLGAALEAVAQPAQSAPPADIDLSTALDRVGGQRPLLRSLADAFQNHAPQSITGLQIALKNHDDRELKRIAHLLRGQAKTLGINALSRDAGELEHADFAASDPQTTRLVESIIDTTRKALSQIATDTEFLS
jgi:signal transduction histidine kinase/DNA-binding response OmpR family regulator